MFLSTAWVDCYDFLVRVHSFSNLQKRLKRDNELALRKVCLFTFFLFHNLCLDRFHCLLPKCWCWSLFACSYRDRASAKFISQFSLSLGLASEYRFCTLLTICLEKSIFCLTLRRAIWGLVCWFLVIKVWGRKVSWLWLVIGDAMVTQNSITICKQHENFQFSRVHGASRSSLSCMSESTFFGWCFKLKIVKAAYCSYKRGKKMALSN